MRPGSQTSLVQFCFCRVSEWNPRVLRFAQNGIVATLVVEADVSLHGNLQLLEGGITEIVTMAETYVPLISSGTAGPLGVLHLPRLWQKVSLEESGKLASGYPGVGKGFDAMTLDALGLEEQAVRDFIRQSKPTYPQFEAWIKKNAKSLNRDSVEKHNAAVRGYNHDDETRKGILGACKIADDASSPKDAVNLNNLDDWYEFHQAVLA
jgi:hypothetical protein